MKFSQASPPLLAAAFSMTLLAVTCYAAVTNATVSVQLHGVDETGNPSTNLGQEVDGKSYKDSETGIIFQIGSGLVTNEFRRRITFEDRGLTVTDPDNPSVTRTSTSDTETISRPVNSRFGWNVQVAVYTPESVPTGRQ